MMRKLPDKPSQPMLADHRPDRPEYKSTLVINRRTRL